MFKIALSLALLFTAIQAFPATAATFLFIRHAESTSNAGTASTVDEALDPPLTAKGSQQALDLARVLAKCDVKIIYTSAYQRTQQTIAPTAARFGLAPIADVRTNEWYMGDLKSLDDRSSAKISDVLKRWAAGNTVARADLPNAESLDDMVARVVPAWTEILHAHQHEDGVVLLVGHGAEIGFVMPHFATNITREFAFKNGLRNTGIVQVEMIDGKPVVTNWQGVDVAPSSAVVRPPAGRCVRRAWAR